MYWPERNQVFWRLGDLAAGANGIVSARVRFNGACTLGNPGRHGGLPGRHELRRRPSFNVTPYLALRWRSAHRPGPRSVTARFRRRVGRVPDVLHLCTPRHRRRLLPMADGAAPATA